jgi:uncharacterized protein
MKTTTDASIDQPSAEPKAFMINRNPSKPQVFTVLNTRSGLLLCDLLERANTPWSRFWGLMNKPTLPQGHGLWIEPCADIHSCFMRFTFDAVFVDKAGVVLHMVAGMRPWRVSKLVWGGRAVLELPAGTIAQSDTHVGDILQVQAYD